MSSTNATVTCTSTTAKFDFNRIENVYISGMTFQGCRNGAAAQMRFVTQALIIGNSFVGNGATALQMITVTQADFTENNFVANRVAAIQMITGTQVVIMRNNFVRTGATAVRLSGVTRVTVMISNFTENRGDCLQASDSSINISDSNFYNTSGRALYITYSNVKITRSALSINRASNYYNSGGAILASYSNITLESSQLTNNYAYRSGGAIYMENGNGNFEL